MNAEEQLREMRGTTQVTTRSQVKNKILSLTMLAIASMCAVFGYKQQLEAKAQRDEVIRLHREIKRLMLESEAARKEATMLRILMKEERRKADAALVEAQKKK
ncbi:MAG: hypothetical protein WAZ98_10930 [Cyclobacteriaceae bacterium]